MATLTKPFIQGLPTATRTHETCLRDFFCKFKEFASKIQENIEEDVKLYITLYSVGRRERVNLFVHNV